MGTRCSERPPQPAVIAPPGSCQCAGVEDAPDSEVAASGWLACGAPSWPVATNPSGHSRCAGVRSRPRQPARASNAARGGKQRASRLAVEPQATRPAAPVSWSRGCRPAANCSRSTRSRGVGRGGSPTPTQGPSAPAEVPDDPPAPARRALLESVDGCPLGTTLPRHSEAGPCRLPPLGARSCGRYPPPEGPRSHPAVALRRSTSVRWTAPWETQWGQSDGRPGPVQHRSRDPPVGGLAPPDSELLCPAHAGCRRGPSAPAFKIVTWLILPVVICLSQRLSHACLSISNLYRETANGSLNQLSFI